MTRLPQCGTRADRTGGFTLMELLVTMTVVALLFAMVVPNLGTFVPTARLEGSGKQIQHVLDFIRSEARIRGREMAMELDLDRARWQVLYPPEIRLALEEDPDSFEEWSFGWQYLEDSVVFSGAGDARNGLAKKGNYSIRFDEYGFTSDQVIVLRLENEPDKVWSLILRGLTGATRIEMSNEGKEPELPFLNEGAF